MKFRALAVALLAGVAGCMTIQPVREPAQFIPAKHPQLLWVTNADGELMVLSNPKVDGDQVVGLWEGIHEEVKVPLANARLIEARQVSRSKTAILGGTLALTAGFLTYWTVTGHATPVPCLNPEPGAGNWCNAGDPTKGR